MISPRNFIALTRLDKPAGIYLLLLPCFWGLALAGGDSVKDYLLFAVGAVVMRSAGCIINDIWDRKIDVRVARTKNRPIASGDVSIKQAFSVLFLLLFAGLGVLISLKLYVIILGFIFTIPVVVYPLMKRIMPIPQLFLGLTFNAGVLMGYVQVMGEITLPAVLLYFAGVFWTLGYDTIYAMQDKDDDALIGVGSSALLFGEHVQKIVAAFFAVMFILLMIIGFIKNYSVYYFVLQFAAGTLLVMQIITFNKVPFSINFKRAVWVGVAVWAGFL
jgi:4-hydroxybenzoate polyprenyltransferase